jgi:hypothetical protein
MCKKNKEESNQDVVSHFVKKHRLTTQQEDTLMALCNRADNSGREHAISATSVEGKRINPILSRIGYVSFSRELKRSVSFANGEIVFGIRANASQLSAEAV